MKYERLGFCLPDEASIWPISHVLLCFSRCFFVLFVLFVVNGFFKFNVSGGRPKIGIPM
jgi:hypothetical protein